MATVALNSAEGRWVMASAILASSMAFIDGTALNVVLPALQKNLNASGTDLFWLLNAYLLMIAALTLMGGSLGDKLGRKKIFMLGIFIFITASVACGFAPSVKFLIAFRVIQGIGGALMIPGSLSLISASINTAERGKAIGTWSAVTTIVTMGGPILGGALADAGLWRYIFFINVPIGIAALIMLWLKVKESRDEGVDHSIDFPGAIAIAFGLALLTFGCLRIPQIGFHHAEIYISIVTGLLSLAVFIFIEKKSRHPMMPLDLFNNSTFTGTNLLSFFLYAGLGAGMLFLSLNMVQAQGYSQLQSGLTFLPFTLLMISIARFAGAFADKHGPRSLLIAGPAIAGVGFILLSFVQQTNGASEYWSTFFPGIIVFGFGMSLTVAPLTATVMGSVPDHSSGIASGINNAITRIANVFANAIFGVLAVVFFSSALQTQISEINLNSKEKQMVIAQAVNLGNAKAPASINNKAGVQKAYQSSFIHVYQNVMRISACLAFAGALITVFFIKDNAVKKE